MRALPEAMREKVMAAAELFATAGLDATKMEDVAAATGVPKATLYYHFAGKEDILAFLFAEVLDELERGVAAAVGRDGSAAERLHQVVLAHLQVIEAHPAANRALQLDLGRAARLPTIAARIDAAFLEPVQALLVAGAADGSLRAVDHPRLAATAVLGAVTTTGINALTTAGDDQRPHRPVTEIADDLATFILRGAAP